MIIHLKVTFSCNNNCFFCVQGNKRKLHSDRSLEGIRRILKINSKHSNFLVLSGGEPTIRKDLLDIVRSAKSLGYKFIQIQTNGRFFSYEEYAKKMIEAGVNDFFVSIHGVNSKMHDCLTRSKGSFLQTTKGIRNLKKLGQRVATNIVITKQNYTKLPEIARLLVEYGVDQIQFAYPHIIHNAELYRKKIIVRKTSIIKYVYKAIDVVLGSDTVVMTEAIPFCFMRGYEQFVAEPIIPASKLYDADFVIKNYSTFRKKSDKSKSPRCGLCVFDKICEGPWKEYPRLFGWDEFIPVKNDE